MKHPKLKNMRVALIIIILFGGIFTACNGDRSDSLDLAANVDILSFKVNNVEGIINNDNGTIIVMVPSGTNLSAVAPVVELPQNATVSPASGVAQNFSFSANTPIEYRVFNGNLYNSYRVTVIEIKAEITSFRIGNRNGIINQSDNTIVTYVPEGTDVTELNPVIEYTDGAVISPEPGSFIDFSSAVTYTLSYQGETFIYSVTVIPGDEPKLPLLIYNGEDVTPQWDNLGANVNNATPNPKTDGINNTPFCISFVRDVVSGEGWHGGALWNDNQVHIDPAEYNRFSIMILKEVAGDVQLEVQSNGEANKDWLRAWYSEDHLGEWQELVFYIPAERTAIINNILVMPHEHPNGAPVAFPTHRMYWDELKALPKD